MPTPFSRSSVSVPTIAASNAVSTGVAAMIKADSPAPVERSAVGHSTW